MLTAFSQRDLIERARDAGAMAYLVKPFARHELVPAIELAVSRFAEKRALEDEVAEALGRVPRKTFRDETALEKELHRLTRQAAQDEIGKKPEVTVVVSRLT